jgi:hypothetical protein
MTGAGGEASVGVLAGFGASARVDARIDVESRQARR